MGSSFPQCTNQGGREKCIRGGGRHRGCRGIEEFRDYEALLFSLLFWPSNVSPKDAHVLVLETVNMTLYGKKRLQVELNYELETTLDSPVGPKCHHKVLIRGRQGGQAPKSVGSVTTEAETGAGGDRKGPP